MLHVTQRATTELRSLIKDSRAKASEAVKFVPNGRGGLAMTVGAAAAGDMVIQADGRSVLIVAAALAPRLDGRLLDVIETTVDDRVTLAFTLRAPTAEERAAWDAADVPHERGLGRTGADH